jgi:hypothetical protein
MFHGVGNAVYALLIADAKMRTFSFVFVVDPPML